MHIQNKRTSYLGKNSKDMFSFGNGNARYFLPFYLDSFILPDFFLMRILYLYNLKCLFTIWKENNVNIFILNLKNNVHWMITLLKIALRYT